MISLNEALFAICDKSNFNAGNLTGEQIHNTSGRLAGYVVKSYGVTIARWVIGNEPKLDSLAFTHSKTTSRHANIVKKAWGI